MCRREKRWSSRGRRQALHLAPGSVNARRRMELGVLLLDLQISRTFVRAASGIVFGHFTGLQSPPLLFTGSKAGATDSIPIADLLLRRQTPMRPRLFHSTRR